jgi:hypothetical protein
VPFVLAYFDRHGELPMTFGFRALAGPFELLGPSFLEGTLRSVVAVSLLLHLRSRRPVVGFVVELRGRG